MNFSVGYCTIPIMLCYLALIHSGPEEGLSFDDSDHFEEDSLCSWMSEPESLCRNWRGWQTQFSSCGNVSEPRFEKACNSKVKEGMLEYLMYNDVHGIFK